MNKKLKELQIHIGYGTAKTCESCGSMERSGPNGSDMSCTYFTAGSFPVNRGMVCLFFNVNANRENEEKREMPENHTELMKRIEWTSHKRACYHCKHFVTQGIVGGFSKCKLYKFTTHSNACCKSWEESHKDDNVRRSGSVQSSE